MDELKKLQEKKDDLARAMRALSEEYNGEERGNAEAWEDGERRAAWDQVNSDYNEAVAAIDAAKEARDIAGQIARLDEQEEQRRTQGVTRQPERQEERGEIERLCAGDTRDVTADIFDNQRFSDYQRNFRDLSLQSALRESRAMTTGTAGTGGNLLTNQFSADVEISMLAWGGMLANSDVITTPTGEDFHLATIDDTGQVGALVAESADGHNSGAGGTVPTTGRLTLGSYKISSQMVLVPFELLEDNSYNLSSRLAQLLGTRLGRKSNAYWTTGTGSGQPNGIVTAASVGKTAAATGAVTWDEIMDLEHSVDPFYRAGAKFMFNDSVLNAVRLLKDGDSRYLFNPNVSTGRPDTVFGYPLVINQDMADMATTTKSILFGDLSKYTIRRVNGVRFKRFDELYAANDQVAFEAIIRIDGDLLDSGTDPVKVIQMA
jgi:HK97 family phage major capsid protein